MHTPHAARLIARWVLMWFALSLGAAIASPLINPQSTEMVCSAAGVMRLVVHLDDGSTELAGISLDCPLCANLGAPPPPVVLVPEPVFDLAFSLLPLEVARIASLLRGPWQARAPPRLS
jgi:hypothetical protein